MPFDVSVKSVSFSDDTLVTLPNSGVTVVVGPNNAGKTLFLRELSHQIGLGGSDKRLVTTSAELSIEGAPEEVEEWLIRNSTVKFQNGRLMYSRHTTGVFNPGDIASNYRHQSRTGVVPHFIVQYCSLSPDLDNRSRFCDPVPNYDVMEGVPSEALHYVFTDPSLESKISELSRANFGTQLSVNKLGSVLNLLVGATSEAPFDEEGKVNQRYIEAVTGMPKLHEQGHGMRNFFGLYLAVALHGFQVLLVDEPEAFLHPPQARSLGTEMSRLARETGTQVIVSTHSLDFLRGVLDHGAGSTAVVRLSRNSNGTTRARHLPSEQVKEVWSDTLLRYSGILDGLFYRLTVLCEGDPDCRFFAAVGAQINGEGGVTSPADVNFVPVGGKQRFPVALKALHALDVPVRVIADFDLVRDKGELKRTIMAASKGTADWPRIEKLWNTAIKPINDANKPVSIGWLSSKINTILREAPGGSLDAETKKKISAELVMNDSWANLKRSGISGIPNGQQRTACEELIEILTGHGVFVSPHGELESFVPQVGGHGPAWVADVLDSDLHLGASSASEFLRTALKVSE